MADNQLLGGTQYVNRANKSNPLLVQPYAPPSPEENYLASLPPDDPLWQQLRNKRTYTPAQAAENRANTLRDIGYMTPIVGNVMSAMDAPGYYSAAANAPDTNSGRQNMLLGNLSMLGAITGLPFGRTAQMAAQGGKDSLNAILAWHGSPHNFDRFDMSKIGTGEGAQAYGHGLYFAEHPEVAKAYRDALSNRNYSISGEPVEDAITAHWADVKRRGGNIDEHLTRYRNEAEYWRQMAEQKRASGESTSMAMERYMSAKDNADALDRVKNGDVASTDPGALYKTELDVNHEDLLDWDKPLSQQSEKVKAAIAKINPAFVDAPVEGQSLYRFFGDNAEAAKKLREAGILGIRYLDQGSRSATGDPTHNFVLFDDSLAKILSKE